ncbi:MAG: LLM class flavin-dependent oxidoreductase [Candidatus Kariarchaeaceae archaeon]|jgi:alkanesulfonate monooxygenase SsuD/methylene tetrahydromethanopterin reductase-like flavin-dependent oxidoreductase (luciferase family)
MNSYPQFGLLVPPAGIFNDPHILSDLAKEAETAGWNGFFIWDQIIGSALDPWVALSAVAMKTKTIKLGTMITPVARRRPWKLARETLSLDSLSNGRLILGVGLGDPDEAFTAFNEEGSPKIRAEKLDEGLDVLTKLWANTNVSHESKHFKLTEVAFAMPLVQEPRIPIWVGGTWPRKRPFIRAAKWDGIVPYGLDGPLTVDQFKEIKDFILENRTTTAPIPFEFINMGNTPENPKEAMELLSPFIDEGMTWWMESIFEWENWRDLEYTFSRIKKGPPKTN